MKNTTQPINLENRTPTFRYAPQLVLGAGYLLGLLILLGAVSTWFIPTNVSVSSSGTLNAHVTPLKTDDRALIVTRHVAVGRSVQAGESLLDYTTDTQRLAEASLGHELRITLGQLSGDAATAQSPLVAQLQQTLAMLNAQTSSLQALSPATGWLLADAHHNGSGPTIIPAGEPLAEIGDGEQLTLTARIATDYFPGVVPGETVEVLLPDFGGEEISGTLLELTASAAFEFPIKQFTEAQVDAFHAQPETTARMLGTDLPATIVVGSQTVTITLGLDPLPLETHAGIRARRGASFELAGQTLRTKWGSLASQVAIALDGSALPPAGSEALTTRLMEGQRTLPVASCWIQADRRKLFWRLFGS